MSDTGKFEVVARCGHARAGLLHTAHGVVETPVFMPVGTVGSVKALAPDDLDAAGAQVILGNTYHLYLRPGDELVARRGGLHRFMRWDRPILTDSGGFQAFSLGSLNRMKKDGVEFRSHIDGSRHMFTPEKVIGIQRNLGSDIMMPLDVCLGYGASPDEALAAVRRTTEWAGRCREAYPAGAGGGLLFGIVQGCTYPDLRRESARQLMDIGFEGYSIGGLAVGEPKHMMMENLRALDPVLPQEKPRYLMGVGTPLDILHAIESGVDMFDCVLPTRNARNGTLYTSQGKINIKRREYAEDDGPLDPRCGCYTCRTFSRAYLRHLFASRELLAFRLNSLHNITYFLDMARAARRAVIEGRYAAFKAAYEAAYPEEDLLFDAPVEQGA